MHKTLGPLSVYKRHIILFLICLIPVLGLAQAFSAKKVIDNTFDGASRVHAADLDGDGYMDVLATSTLGDEIAWYENNQSGGFSARKVIDSVGNPYSVNAADFDKDGDMDVLAAAYEGDSIVWYENNNADPIVWTKHTIVVIDRPISVYPVDLDGDSNMDVLAVHNGDRIQWYKGDGLGSFTTQPLIHGGLYGGAHAYPADVDGDGDMDVLGPATRFCYI